MRGRTRKALGAGLVLGLLASGARAGETGGMCAPMKDPVLVVLVESPAQVKGAAAGISRSPALVDEADTVIFADGRVVTSSLASTSAHLNALGWASRRIEIAGAGTLAPATKTRRRG